MQDADRGGSVEGIWELYTCFVGLTLFQNIKI